MVPSLTATQTVERARALLESGRGAALPELLKLIETLSIDIYKVSIGELAELVEKDAVILSRIITVPNKLAHNPGISPIATVSQAIHQIGYNRIRTVAVSLMLLDNASGSNPPEQREAAALALSAGLIAQGAAEFQGGAHDPELAFACAALRQLGRILMAAISPEHYRDALALAKKEPQLDGFRRRFGLTAIDLSRKVLVSSRLPEEVVKALREAEPETLNGTASQHDVRLLGLADYAGRLAALTLDEHEPDDGFVRKITQLGRRFARVVPHVDTIAEPALLRANEKLRSFTRCSGVTGLPTGSLQKIRQRLEVLSPGAAQEAEQKEQLPVGLTASGIAEAMALAEAEAEAARLAPATISDRESTAANGPATAAPAEKADDAKAPAATSPDAPAPEQPWDAALNRSPAFAAQTLTGVSDGLSAAVNLALSSIGAKEAWVFRRVAGGTAMSIVGGQGEACSRFKPRATVRADERSIFGVCLTRREVVLIHDTADATLRTYLPPWWREVGGGPRAFALVPIAPGDEAHTLVLLGWPESRRVQLTRGQVSLVQQLFATLPEAPARAA